jgi:HD-GYP domain-containing protein (c-di-GMP phosphodiesterase class II)
MTGINEIRHYLLRELPVTIKGSWHSLEDILSSISPYLYIAVIILLLIITFFAVRKIMALHQRERKKRKAIQKLSKARSMQDYLTTLTQYFKEDHPAIKSIGIYVKDRDVYKLVNTETYEKEMADKSFFPEVIMTPAPEHETRGRYHTYTFAPANKDVAVGIVSFDAINFERLQTDLEYLSALMENFAEKDHLKTELLKTRVLNEVKDIFSSPAFNMESYFTFIGNIILKAGNLDGVKIIFGEKRIVIGHDDFLEGQYKRLKVRNTDINMEICRKSGVSQEDIVHIGRFLDLISAMLSFYSNRTLVDDFLYVLETAVKSFEDTGEYYRSHSEKVEFVAVTVGEKLGLDTKSLEKLKYAARLHDIGMIGDIYDLTLKDLRLSDKDYSILKYHPLIGSTITAPIDSLNPISDIILQHHEFNDGTGYPHGITAENILTESKILSLSEIFVGLVSERPHRKAYGFEEAIRQISDLVPNKLDPDVFKAFVEGKNTIMKRLQGPI